jgi:Ca-activated chloride channel family protein
VEVSYDGPDLDEADYLTIVPAGAEDGDFGDYRYVELQNKTSTLTTPFEPGDYEVRYMDDQDAVLARALLTLEQSEITMRPLTEVHAGAYYEVEWTGPNGKDDYITLVEDDAPDGSYEDYRYTRDGSPLQLTAPLTPGNYELRYQTDRSGETKQVFARVPVVVLEAIPVFMQAPAEVVGGSEFEVEWAGPDNPSDYITIVPKGAQEGAYTDYVYTRDGNPISLSAPVEPGDYELRYMNDNERKMIASIPIKIIGASASLQAVSEAMAGTAIEVSWSGSSSDSDYITIVPAGADDGAYADYSYTREGNPVKIETSFEPGSYEVRMVNDNEDIVLARAPLTLTAVQITLQAPAEVAVNTDLEISWTGPAAERSYITIVPVNSPANTYGNYTYIEAASGTISLRSPDQPGSYEVRYLSADNIARHSIPITVK